MTKQLTRAKEIFIENLGSYDNMQEEGCLREYLQYHIPMETECNWMHEFILEQFNKADSKCITVSDLTSSVSFVISRYGRYEDYKKLLAIKDKYLKGADLLELNMYYHDLLRSIESLPENNHIDGNAKLEIVTELENMVVETKENIDSIPDERTGYLVKAYNLQVPASFRKDAQLNEIYEGITSIKGLLQK